MNLERLKLETRDDHRATEAVMPLMQAGLTREQYTATLYRLYCIVRSWERWAEAHAPADLYEMAVRRQRAPLLERDLQVFGEPAVASGGLFAAEKIPGLQSGATGCGAPGSAEPACRASFLGAMYVMEGSTLGGQYIARHVEHTLNLTPGEGDAYFRGYAERTGELWLEFKALLAQLPETDADTVIAAARAMFGIFREQLLA